MPCPRQEKRTAVILIIGQSNAANYATRAYRSNGESVLNLFDDRCYIAQSPLLGADGPWGEYWTELGNRLVAARVYRRVILISSAIGATSVARWQVGGDGVPGPRSNLNPMLMEVVSKAQKRYKITHVLWHQGESDFNTSEADYRRSFLSLVSSLRNQGVSAPIYVSVASANRRKELPNVRAQKRLPDAALGIYAGVNTDALVEREERNETGHFGPNAQEKVIRAWMAILSKPLGSHP